MYFKDHYYQLFKTKDPPKKWFFSFGLSNLHIKCINYQKPNSKTLFNIYGIFQFIYIFLCLWQIFFRLKHVPIYIIQDFKEINPFLLPPFSSKVKLCYLCADWLSGRQQGHSHDCFFNKSALRFVGRGFTWTY